MEVKARRSLHQTPHFRSANPKYLSHCDTYKHRNCSSPSASPLTQAEHRLRAGTPPPQPALALTPFLISDFHLSAVNTPLYPNLNSETITFFFFFCSFLQVLFHCIRPFKLLENMKFQLSCKGLVRGVPGFSRCLISFGFSCFSYHFISPQGPKAKSLVIDICSDF